MRQNVRTKNPEEKDIKFQKIKIQSIQAGETMPGWQETPGNESTRLKTRLRKMMTRNMEKLRNYLRLELAHNFLIY